MGDQRDGGIVWCEETWSGHDDDGKRGEALVYRIGKHRSGRMLDGVLHDERPLR